MATDVRFIQKYNEVVLENFNAVLKQNLLFQAQIGVMEDDVKLHNDYETIKADVSKLIQENTSLRNELSNKNSIIQNNTNTDGERNRLQTALNKQSKEISNFTDRISRLEKEIDEHKEYIKKLEDMLPNSKKKKMGIEIVEVKVETEKETVESIVTDDVLNVESSGGNF